MSDPAVTRISPASMALGTVGALCVLLFAALRLSGASAGEAGSVALAPLSLVSFVDNAIRKRRDEVRKVRPSRGEFAPPAWRLILYTALWIAGLGQVGSALGGFVVGVAGGAVFEDEWALAISISSIIGILLGGFFAGRWLGARADTRPFVMLLVASVVGALISRLFDFVFLSADELQSFAGVDKSLGSLVLLMIGPIIVSLIGGALGVWRGLKRREDAYLLYLISLLRPEERGHLVDLVYEEAQRVAEEPASA